MKFNYYLKDSLIIITNKWNKQLAFIDLTTNTLYNTRSSYEIFYKIASEFKFMLQGFQYMPSVSGIDYLA